MRSFRIAASLVLATFGTLLVSAVGLRASPDLFLLPVAGAARGGAAIAAMVTGLLAGLLQDALTNPDRLLGLHAFAKVFLGYLVAMLSARTLADKPLLVGAILAGAVVLEAAVLAGLLLVLRQSAPAPVATVLAQRAVLTGLLGAALHRLSQVPWRERREARRRRRLSS